MKTNMGVSDRGIRVLVATTGAILCITGTVTGIWAVLLACFSVILFLTAVIGSCPLYLPFGINTLKRKHHHKKA